MTIMLMGKNKIKIKDLLDINEKIEANEHYDKNKKDYDEKFGQYKSKLGKELAGDRNFEFYKSITTTIKKIFGKSIGSEYQDFDFSQSDNPTGKAIIEFNRDEYNCLTELCDVAGVKIDTQIYKSDFLIKNGFKFEEKDFLERRKNVILGLANRKLITMENDNNNPPGRTFRCDGNILFDIIK